MSGELRIIPPKPRGKRQIPEHYPALIRQLCRNQKYTQRVVAKMLGISQKTVSTYARRKKGKPRKPALSETEKIRIQILATDPVRPWKPEAIAAKLGRGQSTVQKYMMKAGIERSREYQPKAGHHVREAVRRDYLANELTIPQIAKRYRISKRSVHTYCQDLHGQRGQSPHGPRGMADRWDDICFWLSMGRSFAQIARIFGADDSNVSRLAYRRLGGRCRKRPKKSCD